MIYLYKKANLCSLWREKKDTIQWERESLLLMLLLNTFQLNLRSTNFFNPIKVKQFSCPIKAMMGKKKKNCNFILIIKLVHKCSINSFLRATPGWFNYTLYSMQKRRSKNLFDCPCKPESFWIFLVFLIIINIVFFFFKCSWKELSLPVN